MSEPQRKCPVCDCLIIGAIVLDDHELWPDRPWIANHEGGRFCALTDVERGNVRF